MNFYFEFVFYIPKLIHCFFFNFSNVLHRHWLFGEKVQFTKQEEDKNGLNEPKSLVLNQVRIRGWFPRNCAVELVNPESEDELEHFAAKKMN